MSLQFILGNSGSGKTSYMYSQIVREAEANKDKNYLVIVPEQFTLATQEMLVDLSDNGAIMNVDVLSFKRLAFRVFDDLGINRLDILEETGKNLVLRRVAQEKEKELGILKGNMNRMGYISEVKSLLSELMQYNITPDTLKEYIDSGKLQKGLSEKLSDVLVMYQGFEDFMKDRYITAEEVLTVLKAVAADSELLRGSVLAFDEFTGFTPIQNQLLREILPMADQVMVALTIDSKEDFYHSRGMHELFDMPKKTIKSLMNMANELGVSIEEPVVLASKENFRGGNSRDLFFLEQNLFRKKQQQYEQEVEDIRLVSAETPREELMAVAREINHLVQEKGYRYKDIAVLSGDINTYSNYAESILGKYHIPFFIDATTEILFHPFIEFIKSLIDVYRRDFSMEAVLRFVRCGFCDIPVEQIDVMENYLLATGIRGKNNWGEKWLRKTRQKHLYDLEALNEVREKIYGIFQPIDEAFSRQGVTVSERIRAIYKVIVSLDIEAQLMQKEKQYLDKGQQVKAKEYEQIYRIVMELLEEYIMLLGQDQMNLQEFTEILEAGFDAAQVAALPPGYDSVTLGDIERTRLNDVKVVFFIGVNDGIIPKANNMGGIISQYERETLRELEIELAPGAREKSFIQRFYLYINMTKPTDRLYISFSRTGSDGKACQESYLIGIIKRLFPRISKTVHESILSEMNSSTVEASMDYLIFGEKDEKWYALARWLYSQPDKREYIENLLLAKYIRYVDTPISREVARAVYGRNLTGSVTRLEQYSKCAYAHFLNYGIKLRGREESGFAFVDMGNIYHNALDRYSKKLENSEYDWFSVDDHMRDEMANQSLMEAVEEYPNLTAYGDAESHHMIERMEHIFRQTVWALTTQVKKGNFVPDNFEISFELADQNSMDLKGRIDRVDTCLDDNRVYVKVIDYKSGKSSFSLLKLYHGVQLQLAIYMNAALEKKQNQYKDREIIPGGLFYYNIDDPVIEFENGIREEDIKHAILKALKPVGIINSAEEVYRNMDTDLEKESEVIPLSLTNKNVPKKSPTVMPRENIELIGDYTNMKARQIAEEIFSGRITVEPTKISDSDSCTYCEYNSICKITSRIPGLKSRTVKKMDNEELFEAMERDIALEKAKKEEQ